MVMNIDRDIEITLAQPWFFRDFVVELPATDGGASGSRSRAPDLLAVVLGGRFGLATWRSGMGFSGDKVMMCGGPTHPNQGYAGIGEEQHLTMFMTNRILTYQ
ncbi:Hypothetical predicted protein [Prunus dulcis]|uniref:Uncharacterized protein n=1 Tax=Prunus dulcis TaxID=3755 RepID=A0A5E4GJ64_PRUDU|nr:Hypothetical predicted protein [Prunus dulcis]